MLRVDNSVRLHETTRYETINQGAHFPALAAGEAGAPVGASVRPRIETENGTSDGRSDVTCEAGNVTCQRYT